MTLQNKFDGCFALDDDEQALTCLKDLVKNASGDCRPKLVLLTRENCVPCQEEKATRKADIDSGVIQEVNINSAEGLAIMKKNDIDHVPALVFLDCKDNLLYPSV